MQRQHWNKCNLLKLCAGVWLHNAHLILCFVFLLWWFWTHSALWFRHHRAWVSTTQLFSVWYLPVLLTRPLWSALLSSPAGFESTFSSPISPILINMISPCFIYTFYLFSLLSPLTFCSKAGKSSNAIALWNKFCSAFSVSLSWPLYSASVFLFVCFVMLR